ncbi:putative electon transport protein SCO1/SCO2 [Trypanosoma grayi]|uniref:putative electon transport protein SCO1/SCO2 n=1 Tax=Trypanosoma grayi TaxID=71804 RepID=UPI0004F4A062|nr:putative electon transport protein SCO1/SCO2 [Trypanosoma grayi]KEG08645.1 putative electon transport protein SCO1/SCO2 [Trypanosoma grayi]
MQCWLRGANYTVCCVTAAPLQCSRRAYCRSAARRHHGCANALLPLLRRPRRLHGPLSRPDVTVLCVWARLASSSGGNSGGKDIDVVDATKPIHIRVAEQKDSQIFTMQDYIEREEAEQRASKALGQRLSDARDNPAWMLWALLFLSLGVLTVVVSIRVRREQLRFDPKLRAVKVFDSPDGPSIGGPFSLVGVDGRRYTDEDFRGKWLYIYFGFTNCPDVCPEEMAKMSRVVQHLDKKVGRDYWQPLFISLDPHRDTPEKIREYLADFSPRILGLVGTQEEVEAAAREYRVYFAVPDEEAMSEDDYLVDHSIIMYLMDPEGKFCDYTTKEFQWFESYSKLLRRMMDYERAKAQRQQQDGGALQPGETAANMKVANIATMLDNSSAAPSREEVERNRPPQMATVRR